MNRTPPPNRRPNPKERPQTGRPPQNRGAPNRPHPPNGQPQPPRNGTPPQNPRGPQNPNVPRNSQNPRNPQNRPPARNGQYPPQNNGHPRGNPPHRPGQQPQPNHPYGQQPYPNNPYGQQPPYRNGPNPYANGAPQPDPEYLRRKRAIERKQEEARRQIERDRERREKQRRKAERERRIKRGLIVLGGRLFVFSIILLALCILTGIVFLLFFNHAPDKPPTSGNITYYYGGSETRTAPVKEAILDDTVYFCFNDLAEYLGMMESGTSEAMKFILPTNDTIPATSGGDGSEEMITFHIGGIHVNINGQFAQLDIPNVIRGTEVWVSTSFLTDYVNNLSFRYDARKSQVFIARIVDEEKSDEEKKIVAYLPVSFKLKSSAALAPIPEEDVFGASD